MDVQPPEETGGLKFEKDIEVEPKQVLVDVHELEVEVPKVRSLVTKYGRHLSPFSVP